MLREAEEREDRFTLATLYVGSAGLMSLIEDQPAAALQQIERGMEWITVDFDLRRLAGQASHAEVDLYGGDGTAAYRRIDESWRQSSASPLSRTAFVRARVLSTHGLAALAASRSAGTDRRLVRAAARDARGLRALRLPWTRALARILDAGVALVTGARAEAHAQLERAHAELVSAGMILHATLARRRLGELTGGTEGARAIAEADAWLTAQGVRAPERLTRLFMPEVAPPRQLSS
jgi:eukaryotic-like serine/threonine-protein kinase